MLYFIHLKIEDKKIMAYPDMVGKLLEYFISLFNSFPFPVVNRLNSKRLSDYHDNCN